MIVIIRHFSQLSMMLIIFIGASLKGLQRLQVNVMASAKKNFTKVIPMAWVEEFVMMTQKQADDFNSQINGTISLRTTLFMALTIAGSAIALISMLWCACARDTASPSQTVQYKTIYEESLLAPSLVEDENKITRL